MEKEQIISYFMTKCRLDESGANDNYFKLKSELDIFEEMVDVIETSTYPEYPIIEEGYSAEDLANSFNLNVLEAYNLLYMLRTDAEQALENIEKGLPNREIVSDEIQENDISKYDYIIGLVDIKNQLLDFEKYVELSVKIKRTNGIKFYYNTIFTGFMGSGKTLTSIEIAKILKEKKIISNDTPKEYFYYDFVGESIEETRNKTLKILKECRDNLLYIIDIQKLNTDYGHIALNIIFDKLKLEENIIIFEMSEEYIKDFLKFDVFNKIYDIFRFNGYTLEELFNIYIKKINDNRIEVSDEAQERVKEIIEYFYNKETFSYGKFIDLLIRFTLIEHSRKYKHLKKINTDEIPSIERIEQFM